MRFLGNVDTQTRAENLVAHLLTLKISTHVESVESQKDAWEIWVRDEDRFEDAKREFQDFLKNPDSSAYSDSVRKAQAIVRENREKQMAASKNIKHVRAGNRAIGASGRLPPLTLTLTVLCVLLSIMSDSFNPRRSTKMGQNISNKLMFVDPSLYTGRISENPNPKKSSDPAVSIKRGELWRVFTPMFLHGGAIHLLFNMIWLVQLGQVIERREKTLAFAIIILLCSGLPNLLQGLSPHEWGGTPLFVGFSGVVYGLFGYLWIKSTIRPDLMPQINPMTVIIMLGWLVLCFTGKLGDIANLAHLGGLIVGATMGWLAANWTPSSRSI